MEILRSLHFRDGRQSDRVVNLRYQPSAWRIDLTDISRGLWIAVGLIHILILHSPSVEGLLEWKNREKFHKRELFL